MSVTRVGKGAREPGQQRCRGRGTGRSGPRMRLLRCLDHARWALPWSLPGRWPVHCNCYLCPRVRQGATETPDAGASHTNHMNQWGIQCLREWPGQGGAVWRWPQVGSCGVARCRTTLLTVGCHSGWLWLQQPEPFQVVSSVPEPKETTRVVPGATPQGDLVPCGAPSSWMQVCRGRCPKIFLQGHWSCAVPLVQTCSCLRDGTHKGVPSRPRIWNLGKMSQVQTGTWSCACRQCEGGGHHRV